MLLFSRLGVGGVLDNPHRFDGAAQGRGKPRPLLFVDGGVWFFTRRQRAVGSGWELPTQFRPNVC